MIPIQGCVKNYHWGKIGNDSYIARFQAVSQEQQTSLATRADGSPTHSSSSDGITKDDQDKPLAELWFGAHPSGPANVIVDKQAIKLDIFLAKHPEMVATVELYRKFNKKLPFLFKILSIGQPLSLQAHPNKKLAQALHHSDPQNYPDPNHKPELAIALTEFEILCDFRPAKEILSFMKNVPSFKQVVGGDKNVELYSKALEQNESQERQRALLATCFKSLMTCDKEIILKQTKNLLLDLEGDLSSAIDIQLQNVIKEFHKLYPGDPGIFAPFFLNYLRLAPGEAVYLKANKLHAYIKGECIECMACSDNVVRAGLTTKYRDVDTLISMLDYESAKDTKDVLLPGVCKQQNSGPSVISYAPTEEFKVDRVTITQSNTPSGEYTLSALPSGSFVVVLSGKATVKDFFNLKTEHKLTLGSAAYIPPKIPLTLYNIRGTTTIYRAYC